MFKLSLGRSRSFESKLFNEVQFYPNFVTDLKQASSAIIIESPFVSYRRAAALMPELVRAIDRGVHIKLNTRNPAEHDCSMRQQAEAILQTFENLGVSIEFIPKLHRKLAVIDRSILWEGSLNILSQAHSREVMRRTTSSAYCRKMLRFISKNELK